jgi:hypothetical protein
MDILLAVAATRGVVKVEVVSCPLLTNFPQNQVEHRVMPSASLTLHSSSAFEILLSNLRSFLEPNASISIKHSDMASQSRISRRRKGQKKAADKIAPVTTPVTFPLLELPLDILTLLPKNMKSMDLASRVCLGLTCRGLKKLMFPTGFPNESELKKEICLRLERDLPGSFYCYFCDKLHKWVIEPASDPLKQVCRSRTDCLFSRDPGDYNLTYLQARQVMDYARFGRAYDIQLKSIEGVYEFDASRGIKHTELWRAKIIKGKLYLKTTYVFSYADGDDEDLWYEMTAYGPRVCRHDYHHRRYFVGTRGRTRVVEREPGDTRRVDFYECCNVDVEWPKLPRQESAAPIKFNVYRNLGTCRDPVNLTEIRIPELYGSRFEYQRESFRDEWLDDEAKKDLALEKASTEMARKRKALKQKVRSNWNRKRRFWGRKR